MRTSPFRLSGSAYPGTSPTTYSGKQSLMYSDGPLHSLCSFNVARRPAENAKSVIHTQSESNFLAEESQKGSSASSPFEQLRFFVLGLQQRCISFQSQRIEGILSLFLYKRARHGSPGVLISFERMMINFIDPHSLGEARTSGRLGCT